MKTNPMILISAADIDKARKIVSDITRKPIPENVVTYNWSISNKYYSAEVSICLRDDVNTLINQNIVEAHIIYLSKDECSEACINMASQQVSQSSEVRLVVAECITAPPSLEAWAQQEGYELVTLIQAEKETDSESEDEDTWGIERVREALHSHTWSGLQRVDTGMSLDRYEDLLSALLSARDLPPDARRAVAPDLMEALLTAFDDDPDD